jgi:putative MFS transporter
VAGCSKIGGLIAQGLSALALVPMLNSAALAIAVPAALSLALIAMLGRETRDRDLRELEASPASLYSAPTSDE